MNFRFTYWLITRLLLLQLIGCSTYSTSLSQENKDLVEKGPQITILPNKHLEKSVLIDMNNLWISNDLEKRFYITDIILKDAKFITKKTTKKLLTPYLYRYVTIKEINKLTQEIKGYYIHKGYPTTQVHILLGQNIQNGILQILVKIGFIEEIFLNEHTRRDKGKIANSFLFFRGKPLYLPYLENGVDQINSVVSSIATLRILPGLQEGGSVIYIDNVTHNPFRLEIGGDNLGEIALGKWRWKYNLSLDNLFSLNDHLHLHYHINSSKKIKDTSLRDHSITGKFSFPIGYLNFSTSHNISASVTPTIATNYINFYKRNSHSHTYDIKFPIYKARGYKGYIVSGLTHSITSNFLQDVPMQISQNSFKAQIKITFNNTGLLWGGSYMADIVYEQGVALLGAKKDIVPVQQSIKPLPLPKNLFKKINCHLIWMRPLYSFSQILYYQIDFSGQYSRDEISSSYQFNVTGAEQVRGFKQSYMGNKGVYAKQELSWPHVLPFTRWLLPLRLTAGLDIGYMPNVSNIISDKRSLPAIFGSYIIGSQYSFKWLTLDFSYAKPIYSSKHISSIKNSYQVYFHFTCKLHELIF